MTEGATPKEGEAPISEREDTNRREGPEERSRLRARLLDAVGQPVVATDLGGRISYWNHAAEALFGWSAREVLGRPADEVVVPEGGPAGPRGLADEAWPGDGGVWSGEISVRRRDGAAVPVRVTNTPVRDERGNPAGVIGVFADVTGRDGEERAGVTAGYEGIVRALPNVVFRCGKGEDGRTYFTLSEGALAEEFGVTTARVAGKALEELFPPEFRETALPAFEKAFAGETVEFLTRIGDRTFQNVAMPFRAVGTAPGGEEVVGYVTEVTGRVRAEEALRRSEAALADAQRIARVGNWEHDYGKGEIYWSDGLYRVFGLSPGGVEPTWDAFLGRVHPDDRERVREAHREALRKGGQDETEYRVVRSDGEVRVVHHRREVLLGEAGDPVRVAGTVQDVTDQREAERALRESEEQFRSAFESASTGMALVGLDTRYLRVNRALCEMLGYPEGELLGKSAREFTHPDDRAAEEACRERLLRGEAGADGLEKRYVRVDGRTVWALLNASLVRDADGNPGHFVVQAQDITERKGYEEALRRSERNLAEAQRIARLGSWEADFGSETARWSDEMYRIHGFAPQEFVPTQGRFLGLVHPDDRARVEAFLRRTFGEGGEEDALECRVLRPDGGVRVVQNRREVRLGEDGEPVGLAGTVQNVTEQREAKRRVREAEERYRTLVEQIPAVTYVDRATRGPEEPLYVSPQIERILGYTPEEWIGEGLWTEKLHPEDRERVLAADARFESGEEERFGEEYRLFAKDGSVVWVREEAAVVRDEGGEPLYWQGVITDVTERKALEAELEHRAFHDPLTGLPNRSLLLDRLSHALARAGRRGTWVAMLLVDLDNFKVINDSLGHGAGDGLLVAVTRRLRSLVRPEDTVARLGGDEFVFLLEETELPGAVRIAERVVERLREPFSLGGHEVFVTPSVGIVTSTGTVAGVPKGPEDLLREADLAMYRAKRAGKARYAVFEEGMDAGALERLELEHGLRRAVERGELRVLYQPQVSLHDGRIVCLEALLRWEHPTRGLLAPDEFVPVAEETGLIVPIGERVLREACARAQGWRAARPSEEPPAVGVNLSARQFWEPGLAGAVARALAETGLAPDRLLLEVTESAAMEDALTTAATLEELQDLGVRVAIDDFGTGYSSLSYLSRFPVDNVKIDRSFVMGLGEEPGAFLLIRGVTQLAHALGLTVVAEGVETAGQFERLKEVGCDAAQGNLFSEPVPAEAVPRLLADTQQQAWIGGEQ